MKRGLIAGAAAAAIVVGGVGYVAFAQGEPDLGPLVPVSTGTQTTTTGTPALSVTPPTAVPTVTAVPSKTTTVVKTTSKTTVRKAAAVATQNEPEPTNPEPPKAPMPVKPPGGGVTLDPGVPSPPPQ